MPKTEGAKTTEILIALLMKAVGLALVIFATKITADPALQKQLIDWGLGLFGGAGVAYILGRSIRKVGTPIVPLEGAPANDNQAATVVAKAG